MLANYYLKEYYVKIILIQLIIMLKPLFFPLGLVMIQVIRFLISPGFWIWNQSKSGMIVLDQCKHSKSMDWIDWKRSKSERIHLLKRNIVVEMTNRSHFIYWIVNHSNPSKLENIVSVIMLANLNWRIVHNYNPFKLVSLVVIRAISITVPLWFEVLNWYWIIG